MKSLLLIPLLAACSSEIAATPPTTTAVAMNKAPAVQTETREAATIRKSVAAFRSWGRVDKAPNIAPAKCDMPRDHDYGSEGRVHISDAAEAPHGKKLYYLWASNKDAYAHTVVDEPIADGFTIVKEAFVAEPTREPQTQPRFTGDPPLHDKLRVGEQWFTTGSYKGLYVMTKVDGDWLFGTIAPSGEVTSAGKVESCMGCHDAAPHAGLFGPKRGEKHGY